jgi:hypothetical protein
MPLLGKKLDELGVFADPGISRAMHSAVVTFAQAASLVGSNLEDMRREATFDERSFHTTDFWPVSGSVLAMTSEWLVNRSDCAAATH